MIYMHKRNIKLTIAYNGAAYHGWQVQPGRPTIQGTIEEKLEQLFQCTTRICGTSRTDAGVHALGQVANLVTWSRIPTCNMKRAINDVLPSDICIVDLEDAPPGFDPIGGPKDKQYQYKIYAGKDKPIFQQNLCWHYPYVLDADKMNAAAQKLVGTMDFKSFACARDYRTDSIRTIFKCEVVRAGDWITIDVQGNRFMYNMVRNIVGTLVDIGRGFWEPEQIDQIIQARDRRAAGMLAPAGGLYLVKINF